MSRIDLTPWTLIPEKPLWTETIFGDVQALQAAISTLQSGVPYTGATQSLNMGLYDVQATRFKFGSTGPQLDNSGGTIRARTNDGLADAPFSAGSLTATSLTGLTAGYMALIDSITLGWPGTSYGGFQAGSNGFFGFYAGPKFDQSGGTIRARTNNGLADAPITCGSLTTSGSISLPTGIAAPTVTGTAVTLYNAGSSDLWLKTQHGSAFWQIGGGSSTVHGSAGIMTIGGTGGLYISSNPLGSNTRQFLKIVDANNLSFRNSSDTSNLNVGVGTVTTNRSTQASYGVYACGKNSNGYVDWELNEGLYTGYGGSLTLRAGDAANTGYLRLRYDAGYPKIESTTDSFTFQTSVQQLVFGGSYIMATVNSAETIRSEQGSFGLRVQPRLSTDKVLVAKGLTSQTGSLFETQSSTGTTEVSIAPGGKITTSGIISCGTYVTAPAGFYSVASGGNAMGYDFDFSTSLKKHVLTGPLGAVFLGFGGSTSSFPALRRNAAVLESKLADDSGFAAIRFGFISLSADPTTLDLASGGVSVYKNTTSGALKLWANDGGTMKSVALT